MIRTSSLFLFGIVSLLGLGFSAVLTTRGYISVESLRLWADVMLSWESPDYAQDRLALIYPQLRFYLALLFYGAFPLPSPAMLSVFSVTMGGILAALWAGILRRHGWSSFAAIGWALLLVLHPFTIWTMSRGTGESLGLLAFTVVGMGLSQMRVDQNFKGMIIVAASVAAFFLMDHRFVYYAITIIPMISLFAPREMLRKSTGSFLLVALFPLVAAVMAYLYVSWVFTGDGLAFLNDPRSIWFGAYQSVGETPWLGAFVGQFFVPLILAVVMIVAVAPPIVLTSILALEAGHWRILVPVLSLVPIIALAVATLVGFAAHPVEFLSLLMVPLVFTLTTRLAKIVAPVFVGMILVSWFLSWLLLNQWETPDLERWTNAVQGPIADTIFPGERALAAWMPDEMDDVLIDDQSAFAAIVARGSPEGMLVPTTDEFKIAVTSRQLDADYIAVPDPSTARGQLDQINQNFPNLFVSGHESYDLVYDNRSWRVYQAKDGGLRLPIVEGNRAILEAGRTSPRTVSSAR